VITEHKDVTYDMIPEAPQKAVGTSQTADAIIRKMKASSISHKQLAASVKQ